MNSVHSLVEINWRKCIVDRSSSKAELQCLTQIICIGLRNNAHDHYMRPVGGTWVR